MDQFISAFLSGKNLQQLASNFFPYYFTLINKTGNILSQETLTGIQEALKEGKLKVMIDMIQKSHKEAENSLLDLAVISESGTGKSSFINALQGLSHEEEDSAGVGVVENTQKKTPYQHPKYPRVTFWDLPATGTPDFLPETYLGKVGFANYDFFIIISSSRFKYIDILLAQKIKKVGKHFYFVRTKVGSDFYNEDKSKPRSFNRERVLHKSREKCLTNLSDIGVPALCIFLISNFDLADFDFSSLEKTFLKELPAHKHYTFVLLLPSLSEAAVELKRDFLKEKVWLGALKATALAFILFMPIISGFDLPEQEKCFELYRSYFGMDDKSINDIAQNLVISVQEIKSYIKSLNFGLIVKDDSITAKAMKCAESYSSVNGGLPFTIFQFWKTYFLHLKFLSTVADDAKVLLHKTLESSNLRE